MKLKHKLSLSYDGRCLGFVEINDACRYAAYVFV